MAQRKAHTRCDESERTIAKATRIENGYAYCANCYKQVFPHKPCTRCGQSMRAHERDRCPVCSSCKRQNRTCARCLRPIAKAGMIVEGKAICRSCVSFYREPKECFACGKLSSRLSCSPSKGILDPVCDHCRTLDYRTCRVCRKHRKVNHLDENGKAICNKCSVPGSATRTCQACGKTVAGGGNARCPECSIADALSRRVRLNLELLEQPWVRDLFLRYCESSKLRASVGNMPGRIDKYAIFFREIDKSGTKHQDMSQSSLFKMFGAEVLRRQFLVVSFLVEELQIDWKDQVAEDLVERKRTESILSRWQDKPWFGRLQDYSEHLSRNDNQHVSAKTIRMYVNAAAGLLEHSGIGAVTELSQPHVDAFLTKVPGNAASLTRFLRFIDPVKFQRSFQVKGPSHVEKQRRE